MHLLPFIVLRTPIHLDVPIVLYFYRDCAIQLRYDGTKLMKAYDIRIRPIAWFGFGMELSVPFLSSCVMFLFCFASYCSLHYCFFSTG